MTMHTVLNDIGWLLAAVAVAGTGYAVLAASTLLTAGAWALAYLR